MNLFVRLSYSFSTLILASSAYAFDFNYNGIDFRIVSEEQRTVEVCQSYYSGDIDVPGNVISEGITYTVVGIGDYAFESSSGVVSVKLPSTIQYIGDRAFYDCSNLQSITVNGNNPNFSSVDGVLFDHDKKMLLAYPGGVSGSYTIPSSVELLDRYAFMKCFGLTSLEVDASNRNFTSADGVLYDKTGTTLLVYPCGRDGGFVVPDRVVAIGESAFAYCDGLSSVVLPENLMTISYEAFHSCSELQEIKIPEGVITIGNYAFEDCNKLKSVVFSEGLNMIGDGAFECCISLTSLSLPSSLEKVGYAAFEECTGLESLEILGSETMMDEYAFDECPRLMSVKVNYTVPPTMSDDVFSNETYLSGCLYVPAGTDDFYRSVSPWSYFKNIKDLDPSGISTAYDGGMNVYSSGKTIYVDSESSGMAVDVYTIDGKLVKKTFSLDGHSVIAVEDEGIYVVRLGSSSYKVSCRD